LIFWHSGGTWDCVITIFSSMGKVVAWTWPTIPAENSSTIASTLNLRPFIMILFLFRFASIGQHDHPA
jgi:hypothetical protein